MLVLPVKGRITANGFNGYFDVKEILFLKLASGTESRKPRFFFFILSGLGYSPDGSNSRFTPNHFRVRSPSPSAATWMR